MNRTAPHEYGRHAQMGQALLTTSWATVYTVPTAASSMWTDGLWHNTSPTVPVTFFAAVCRTGTASTTNNVYRYTLTTLETFMSQCAVVLATPGAVIQMKASVAGKIAFTGSGLEF